MFDLTGEEREILEEHVRRLAERGSFLDRVKLFFGFEGEEHDIEDLLWGEPNEEGTRMRCSIEGTNAFYMIQVDDDDYVAYYDDGHMYSGPTYLIRTPDLDEAMDAIEEHYLER